MAHEEGGVITAQEAREISTRIVEQGRTPEELKTRYRFGLKEIQTAAENGFYGVPLLVGEDDQTEFTEFIQAEGFRVFQNSTTPEGERVANQNPNGELVKIEVNWSLFEFEQDTIVIERPTGVNLIIRVSSYPLARPLYYTLTGTLVANDYVNGLDEGNLVFDTNGEAAIFLNVKPGGARVGKTVQPLIYYDSGRETLLHAYNELTVIV